MRSKFNFALIFTLFVVFGFCQTETDARTEQALSGLVVADSELASKAGMEILNRGGNAIDAAIATAFALSVVDQASSGLGGGGFMVIYKAHEKKSYALDFRETAPQAARRELYTKDGQPVPTLSVTGGLAVAVPGEVAGLMEARRRFGSLPLPVLMAPAIRLAAEGFALDTSLRFAIERQLPSMRKFAELGRVFLADGAVPREGELIRQKDLAETLKAIAQEGQKIFYDGWIARAIVQATQEEGGVLTPEDLKSYRTVWREPLVGSYRDRAVVTMPPPSSGGLATIQMLNVLEGYKLNQMQHNSAPYLHLVAETMKHAFADRAEHLGDPDFVHVPMGKLTSKQYAAWTRGRISPDRTYPPTYYGYVNYNAEKGGTTHFSVIDRFGNAVSCTQTVNTRFGSKILVPKTGIVLNNEIDDFAIHPSGNVYGLLGNQANSLQPGKRPLSSMAPTIILRNERPELVVGAAGGPRIISATLQAILNVVDFHLPVNEAIVAPRIHHQWMPDNLIAEAGISAQAKQSLSERGHNVRERGVVGVAQAIVIKDKPLGAADPRKPARAQTE